MHVCIYMYIIHIYIYVYTYYVHIYMHTCAHTYISLYFQFTNFVQRIITNKENIYPNRKNVIKKKTKKKRRKKSRKEDIQKNIETIPRLYNVHVHSIQRLSNLHLINIKCFSLPFLP